MARKPNIDPHIYQVDLVAGLFGGFMMVWISSALDQDFSGDQLESQTYAVVSTRLVDYHSFEIPLIDKQLAELVNSDSEHGIENGKSSLFYCLQREQLVKFGISDIKTIGCVQSSKFESDDAAYAPNPNMAISESYDRCHVKISSHAVSIDQPVGYVEYSYGATTSTPVAGWKFEGYLTESTNIESSLPGVDNSSNNVVLVVQSGLSIRVGYRNFSCSSKKMLETFSTVYLIPSSFKAWSQEAFDVGVSDDVGDLIFFTKSAFGNRIGMLHFKENPIDYRAYMSNQHSNAKIKIDVCFYRDSAKRCFTSGLVPLKANLTLNRTKS